MKRCSGSGKEGSWVQECLSPWCWGAHPSTWVCSPIQNLLDPVIFQTFVEVSSHVLCVSRSVVSDSVTPWTVAHQAPCLWGFSRQEYWSRVAMPSSRGSSQPRDQIQVSCFASGFFTSWATKKALRHIGIIINSVSSSFPLPPGDRRRWLKVPITAWSFWWQTPIQESTQTHLKKF